MADTVVAAPPAARTGPRTSNAGAIAAIAQRDITKFLSDKPRIVGSFVLPFLLVVILGNTFEPVGDALGYDFGRYVLTGVLAQTLFQSSALGLVSLLEDRQNDFSQELFIAPVSRYAIVLGKIVGEATVALVQGLGILAFGFLIGVRLSVAALPGLLLVSAVVCVFGGAFGLLMMSFARSKRFADQLFSFVFLPQLLLAGVFNPISQDGVISVLSRLAPMRYAVDLTRWFGYVGNPERGRVVQDSLPVDVAVVSVLFVVFVAAGTALFVRHESNR
ncbi:MAG TPA: ABC transporter permease [Mycobacteriales bacterium]|nr:ABC transporter permease [Mycobacteriales bacterium]